MRGGGRGGGRGDGLSGRGGWVWEFGDNVRITSHMYNTVGYFCYMHCSRGGGGGGGS